MKRSLLLTIVLMAAGCEVEAAVVSGKVGFVTKRGQRPVLSETLIWLEPIDSRLTRKPAATFQMTTRSKTLLPRILAVPAGSTVTFPNEDPISHNLFSLSTPNAFDLGLYRKGAGKTQKFDTPGVINVYCNVHPNMSAVIHVLPAQWYGFADASGAYTFEVPAGKYRLTAWNEQGGTTQSVIEVTSKGVAGNTALTIDSRNHRLQQHKNKFGKAYQTQSSKEY